MKIKQPTLVGYTKKLSFVLLAAFLLAGFLSVLPGKNPLTPKASAACINTAPPTTYGQVTQTVNVATAGNYRVWSRIKAPDTSANSYYFEVDGGCAYDVGDSSGIPANTWTWVNYQDGSTSSAITVNLTAGSHTLTYTGKEANVELDKVMLLTDTSCTPTGDGSNCAVNDTTGPSVTLTSPTNNSTVSGTVAINASASDSSGVSKVDFYVDDKLVGTDTSSSYQYVWDTKTATNAAHKIYAKATDSSGNVSTSSTVNVTVNNPVGQLTVATKLALNKTSFIVGDTVTGTVTYKNTTTAPVTVKNIQLAGRGPGGTNSGGPYLDLTTTTQGPYTVAAGGSITITGSRTFSSSDPTGNWYAYSTYTDSVGGQHDDTNNVSFSVAAKDTTAPTASITAPTAGTTVTVGTNVNITANASDNIGVTKVEFYVDNKLAGSDAASPYAYTWSTTGAAAGAHALTVKAYDAAGNVTTSSAVSVTVAAQPNGNGDTNGDGRVNAIDLSALISHDGQNYPAADFNHDGTVGSADMAILLAKWTW